MLNRNFNENFQKNIELLHKILLLKRGYEVQYGIFKILSQKYRYRSLPHLPF